MRPLQRVLFFFSSRRRHTRYIGDWSSDVCSSDLGQRFCVSKTMLTHSCLRSTAGAAIIESQPVFHNLPLLLARLGRSEERRVGKECRSRGTPGAVKRKIRTIAVVRYRGRTTLRE